VSSSEPQAPASPPSAKAESFARLPHFEAGALRWAPSPIHGDPAPDPVADRPRDFPALYPRRLPTRGHSYSEGLRCSRCGLAWDAAQKIPIPCRAPKRAPKTPPKERPETQPPIPLRDRIIPRELPPAEGLVSVEELRAQADAFAAAPPARSTDAVSCHRRRGEGNRLMATANVTALPTDPVQRQIRADKTARRAIRELQSAAPGTGRHRRLMTLAGAHSTTPCGAYTDPTAGDYHEQVAAHIERLATASLVVARTAKPAECRSVPSCTRQMR
jgi:hypothetical protein